LVNKRAGLADGVLRIPFGLDRREVQEHLLTGLSKLYSLYGNGKFDISVTCNAVLQANLSGKVGLWFGQNFGKDVRNYALSTVFTIQTPAEVLKLPTEFQVSDFANVYFDAFPDSGVSVHSLVNLIYICRRYLSDFQRDRYYKNANQKRIWKLY